MLKELLAAAIRGLARELAINPRNLRVLALLDDEEHLLLRLDAHTLKDLLSRAARKRILRFKLGNVMYDVDLGATTGDRTRRTLGSAPRQRGSRG